MTPVEVRLPWPDPLLSQNGAHGHWAPLAKARRDARSSTGWAARAAGMKNLDAQSVDLSVTFHPPDLRRRDLQNQIAAIKPHLDGIADALNVDDSRFRIAWPVEFAEPVKGGAVLIVVTDFRRAK